MLTDLLAKIKSFLKENQRDLLLAAMVFLLSVASFGLGRLSAIWPEKEPITITNQESGITNQDTAAVGESQNTTTLPDSKFLTPNSQTGAYVASRSGTTYHLPTCSGAKQIKDENKIWFATKADAERAGYKPAANCPGL